MIRNFSISFALMIFLICYNDARANIHQHWELVPQTRHALNLTSAAYSLDGSLIATTSADGTVKIWENRGSALLKTIQINNSHAKVIISNDDTFLYISSPFTVECWNILTGNILWQKKISQGLPLSPPDLRLGGDGSVLTASLLNKYQLTFNSATGQINSPLRDNLPYKKGDDKNQKVIGRSTDGVYYAVGIEDDNGFVHGVAVHRARDRSLVSQAIMGYPVHSVVWAPDSKEYIPFGSYTNDPPYAELFETATGKRNRALNPSSSGGVVVAVDPSDRYIATANINGFISIWDSRSAHLNAHIKAETQLCTRVTFSGDGSLIVTGGRDFSARVWDSKSGHQVATFPGGSTSMGIFELLGDGDIACQMSSWHADVSPDGHRVAAYSPGAGVRVFDMSTKNLLFEELGSKGLGVEPFFSDPDIFQLGSQRYDLRDKSKNEISNIARQNLGTFISPDGRTEFSNSESGTFKAENDKISIGLNGTISGIIGYKMGRSLIPEGQNAQLLDLQTGSVELVLHDPGDKFRSADIASSGKWLVTGGDFGISKIWDAKTGNLLVSLISDANGEWAAITSEGFIDASNNSLKGLSVVRGLHGYSLEQFYQSLYRPDLVRAKLAGDPDGLVKAAAAKLDLDAVVDSGAEPEVKFATNAGDAADKTQDVAISVADAGGGIGKIEWRVKGVTQGIDEGGVARSTATDDGSDSDKPAGKTIDLHRVLQLEPGENKIEVVAYNAAGLIASEPVGITLTRKVDQAVEPAVTTPRLFVLAVGINDYFDGRLRLAYAVPDAKSLADGFKQASAGLYSDVSVTTLLDQDVTMAKLDATFADLGRKMRTSDVFVFFIAGHGKTVDGHYHFIPYDFKYENAESILTGGIDQDHFQAWLSRIPARKSLMLTDTCESGSLTEDQQVASRGLEKVEAQAAAVELLTRAVGRTVLSASTDDAPALEGYHGHGVFSYVLLDALSHADVGSDGFITVTGLANYVDQQVPEVSYQAFKIRQIPERRVVGTDFPLAHRLAVALVTQDANAPSRPSRRMW